MKVILNKLTIVILAMMCLTQLTAADYLNYLNMTVSIGSGTTPDPFANVSTEQSLANIIDAQSAVVSEDHNQSAHVWVRSQPLHLIFDLLTNYDLQTLHFWNYYTEQYDVDVIDLTFLDAGNNVVGTMHNIALATGTNPTTAENITISATNVHYVSAVLTGSNGEIDFNNMGFTGTRSTLRGDFNNDTLINHLDVNLLATEIRSMQHTAKYDLNNDTFANNLDFEIMITDVLSTFFGDANLDGTVNIQDLSLLASAFGNSGGWELGNFNTDNIINIQDLSLLASNFGMPLSPPAVESSPIPTPSSLSLLALSAIILFKRRHIV